MLEFWPPEWINELITNETWLGKRKVMPGSMFTVEDVEYFAVFPRISTLSHFCMQNSVLDVSEEVQIEELEPAPKLLQFP